MSLKKNNHVSIVLIKQEIGIDEAIKQEESIQHLRIDNNSNAIFLFKESVLHTPKWVKSFFNDDDIVKYFKSSITQAVLLIPIKIKPTETRIFAILFGQGRNLLNPNVIEERFGLKTALNIIDDNSLRSLDTSSLETIPRNNRVQSVKLSNITNFEVRTDRDLLKSITGKIDKKIIDTLGTTISGTDSLKISARIDITNVCDKLKTLYGHYISNKYKDSFPWVDNIAEIKDKTLIGALNKSLVDKLNNKEFDKIWMAIPDVVDYDTVNQFKLKHGENKDDIYIEDVMTIVFQGSLEDSSILTTKEVHAINNEGTTIKHWPYYKCLFGEIECNNKLYVINGGVWYLVSNDYVEIINDFYNSMCLSDIELPEYIESNEGEYNEKTAKQTDNILNLDKKCISYGGGNNKIELCDLFVNSNSKMQMVHVKMYSGSSVLSHLFNQGLVSASALLDSSFRDHLNNGILKETPINNFDRNKCEVVFAIITKKSDDNGRPIIPFFSKITLSKVASELKKYGYKVSIKTINKKV